MKYCYYYHQMFIGTPKPKDKGNEANFSEADLAGITFIYRKQT